MTNQMEQNRCPHCNADVSTTSAATLTPAQKELLDFINPLDAPDRVKHLKLLHDVALYHSHGIIDEDEKNALFNAKCLWECIEAIVREARG